MKEITEETSIIVCKECKQTKVRRLDGMFDTKNKRWTDEKGVVFNGHCCPDCHREKQKLNKKNKKTK